jgi:hypothetical protein
MLLTACCHSGDGWMARVMYGFFVSEEMMIATKEGNKDCCIFQHIDAEEEGLMS